MSYIFKYHPDNAIYRNGSYVSDYNEFVIDNPSFPIIEGSFFEYREDGFDLIIGGNHIPQDTEQYETLITAINNLGA